MTIIVTPASQIAGQHVSQTLGLVRGNTIRARHIGRDIVAVLRTLVGGSATGRRCGFGREIFHFRRDWRRCRTSCLWQRS